jgi:hypothetical protein
MFELSKHLAFAGDYDATKTIGAWATGSSVYGTGYEAGKANDGDLTTRWATPDSATWASLMLDFGSALSVSQLRVAEAWQYQRVTSFTLEAWAPQIFTGFFYIPGHWYQVLSGGALGPNYAGSFTPTTTRWLRLTVYGNAPTISEVWAF